VRAISVTAPLKAPAKETRETAKTAKTGKPFTMIGKKEQAQAADATAAQIEPVTDIEPTSVGGAASQATTPAPAKAETEKKAKPAVVTAKSPSTIDKERAAPAKTYAKEEQPAEAEQKVWVDAAQVAAALKAAGAVSLTDRYRLLVVLNPDMPLPALTKVVEQAGLEVRKSTLSTIHSDTRRVVAMSRVAGRFN
jgi:hypothetical protein